MKTITFINEVKTLIDSNINAKEALFIVKTMSATPNVKGFITDLVTGLDSIKWNNKKVTAELLNDAFTAASLLLDKDRAAKKVSKKLNKKPAAKKKELTDDQVLALDSLKDDIVMNMQQAETCLFNVGCALAEAKEILPSAASFIEWSAENCGIKKAQAYKLVKIYEQFKDEKELHGLSMRVFDVLTNATKKVKEEVKQIKKDGGTVTQQTVKNLKAGKEPNAPKETQKDKKINEDGDTQTTHNPLLTDNSFDVNTDKIDESTETKALLSKINELTKALQDARAEVKRLSLPKKVAIPTLMQFSNKHAHVALGLSNKDSKDASTVRKSYRELVNIWNKDSNEAAFNMITRAKDELINA